MKKLKFSEINVSNILFLNIAHVTAVHNSEYNRLKNYISETRNRILTWVADKRHNKNKCSWQKVYGESATF